MDGEEQLECISTSTNNLQGHSSTEMCEPGVQTTNEAVRARTFGGIKHTRKLNYEVVWRLLNCYVTTDNCSNLKKNGPFGSVCDQLKRFKNSKCNRKYLKTIWSNKRGYQACDTSEPQCIGQDQRNASGVAFVERKPYVERKPFVPVKTVPCTPQTVSETVSDEACSMLKSIHILSDIVDTVAYEATTGHAPLFNYINKCEESGNERLTKDRSGIDKSVSTDTIPSSLGNHSSNVDPCSDISTDCLLQT